LLKEESNHKLIAQQIHLSQLEKSKVEEAVIPKEEPFGRRKSFLKSDTQLDLTRVFDICFSFLGLILLVPLFLLIALLIKISSKGPVIFSQQRVGKNNFEFTLYKFRTMQIDSLEKNSLTIGDDKRITPMGKFLRQLKLDELPQLYNVLIGDMSIVGPRPELRKFVNFYNDSQLEVLSVRPGITDYASIFFRNENKILESRNNPEKYYIERIIPIKIHLNKKYQNDKSLKNYFIVIFKTIAAIFR
jgi:lipopolysaccharide/colanic/teichoic acid biosynthesis glycosyltransferase